MENLKNYDGEIIAFFYNPNIFPYEEYLKRLESFHEVSRRYNIKAIEGSYDPDRFVSVAKYNVMEAEGGKRCEACMKLRLFETAKLANKLGIKKISTTLLASPKKPGDFLLKAGTEIGKEYSVDFIGWNYRENGAVQNARKLTNGIYIQDYCGCVYGLYSQKMWSYEKDKKDYEILQKQFAEYAKLWNYRRKNLEHTIIKELSKEKIKKLIGIIKPATLIISEGEMKKLELNGKWLKCKGYNCRLNIMNGE